MTSKQQLGSQLKAARTGAGFSLRQLSAMVGIPATTIEGYEKGNKIPADKFLRIAHALNHHHFDIDGQTFNVNRSEAGAKQGGEQLDLNFSAEYASSRATVKIRPGRIIVAFDAGKLPSVRQR